MAMSPEGVGLAKTGTDQLSFLIAVTYKFRGFYPFETVGLVLPKC